MHLTIFETPIINTLARWISVAILRLLGWRIEGSAPTEQKYVLIAAPHTSNWDFPYTLMVCFALRLRVYWMGKASLFPPVLGHIMHWLGGIAVDRSRSGNLVQSTIDAFQESQRLTVIVPPEGTRGKVSHWKTPTGDLEADMEEIKQFYSGVRGKHPQQFDADKIQVK